MDMEEATFQNITTKGGSSSSFFATSPNVSEKLKQIVIYQGCQIQKEGKKGDTDKSRGSLSIKCLLKSSKWLKRTILQKKKIIHRREKVTLYTVKVSTYKKKK